MCYFCENHVKDRVSVINARFICNKSKWINVSFFKLEKNLAYVELSDGRSFILSQGISGSGSRYISPDEKIVFWVKGDTAFLEENGVRTYEGVVGR